MQVKTDQSVRFLSKGFYRKIYEYILTPITSVVFSAALLVLVMVFFTERALKSGIEEKLLQISKSNKENIEESFKKLEADFSELALLKTFQDAIVAYESTAFGAALDLSKDVDLGSSGFIRDVNAKFTENFQEISKSQSINGFGIALNNGSIVYQSGNETWTGKNLENGSFKDSSVAKCFKSAKSEGKFFSDLTWDKDKKAKSYFCFSIKSKVERDGYKKDSPMGVLIVDIDWNYFQKRTSGSRALIEGGELFLTDQIGNFRTAPIRNSSKDLTDRKSAKFEIVFNEEMKINDIDRVKKSLDTLLNGNSLSGDSVYQVVSKIQINEKVEWLLFVQQDAKLANSPIQGVRQVTLFSFFMYLVVVVALAKSKILRFDWDRQNKNVPQPESNWELSAEVHEISKQVTLLAQKMQGSSSRNFDGVNRTSKVVTDLGNLSLSSRKFLEDSILESVACEKSAKIGFAKIKDLVTSMDEVEKSIVTTQDQIRSASNNFQTLTELLQNVTSKTGVINEIAFQTKLLSFNASVEAARAGEHGRGFSVVADEVGKLAISVTTAANEINAMLANSSIRVHEVVDQNKKGLELASEVTVKELSKSISVAKECGQFFASLESVMELLNQKLKTVDSSTKDQLNKIELAQSLMKTVESESVDSKSHSKAIIELSTVLDELVSGDFVSDQLPDMTFKATKVTRKSA